MKKIIQLLASLGILSVTKGDFNSGDHSNSLENGCKISIKNKLLFYIIVLVLIFVIFIILGMFSGDKNKSGPNKTNSKSSGSQQMYNVTSKQGMITGKIQVDVPATGSNKLVTAIYNLHIESKLPQKLVCNKTIFPNDSECPSVDYYNYLGAVGNSEDTNTLSFYARVDPVYCDGGFQEIANVSDTNYGPYISCWYGKRGSQVTGKFYTGIYATYENFEDFLDNNKLFIIDSAPFTTKKTEIVDSKSESTNTVDWQSALSNGDRVLVEELVIEKSD